MESAIEIQAPEGATTSQLPETKGKIALRWFSWAAITLFFLSFFTLVKLPEVKITNLIQGHLSSALSQYRITLAPQETSFSVFFGLRYKMKKVRVYLPAPAKEVLIDEIQVSPSFLSLLVGKLGADIYLRQDKGTLSATATIRGRKRAFLDFSADRLDFGKLGLLPALARFSANGIISGNGSLSIDLLNPSLSEGDLKISMKNILIDQQMLVLQGGFPFPLPQISISEGDIQIGAHSKKVEIKKFNLGKESVATDDLVLKASGDVTLAADLPSSVLNIQIPNLRASETVRKKLFLEMALAKFQQPDKSFSGISLTGPASSALQPKF